MDEDRNSLRETKLNLSVGEPVIITWVTLVEDVVPERDSSLTEKLRSQVVVFRDEMGNFVFPIDQSPCLQVRSRFQTSDGAVWTIAKCVGLYVGDQRYSYQVSATCEYPTQ